MRALMLYTCLKYLAIIRINLMGRQSINISNGEECC